MLKPRYRLSEVRGFYLTKIEGRINPGAIQQNDSIDFEWNPSARQEFTREYAYGQ
jgi:hypothetical protein